MMIQRIFVDANILVSRTLMDWLFMLRQETGGGMFSIITSEDVLAEVEYRLRRINPEAPGRMIVQRRARIVQFVDEVLEDFDATATYSGADPNDRHVHAAALASNAHILLTDDNGFSTDDSVSYELYSADNFFVLIDDSAPTCVQHVTAEQRAYWSSRGGRSVVDALRAAGCEQFANRVNQHFRTLAGVPSGPVGTTGALVV